MSNTQIWTYDNALDFTFDNSVIEIAGNQAKLKNIQPANSTFFANYNTNINGTFGDGVLTGTATGGAVAANGLLNCKGATLKYVDYASQDNSDTGLNIGTVRFIYKPDYTGAPANNTGMFSLGKNSGNKNLLRVWHNTGNQVQYQVFDSASVQILSANFGVFSFTAGQSYEIEFNYDFVAGATRLFIDGIKIGNTNLSTGSRSNDQDIIRVGSDILAGYVSDAEFDNFILFNTVQHTANYTPTGIVPSVYSIADPFILTNEQISASELLTFTEVITALVGSDDIRYIAQISGSDFYWDGANVSSSDGTLSQSMSAADFNDNATEFLSLRKTLKLKTILHSGDGTTTPAITSASITYNTALPNAVLNNIVELVGFVYDHLGNPIVGKEIKIRPYIEGQSANDVFVEYKYFTVATSDADGYFAGNFMLLNVTKETEIKIGSQSYRTVMPVDDSIIDLNNDLTLTLVSEE